MSSNKTVHSSNKEDILQALTPLNEHVLDNRERLLKALTQRDYVIAEDGRIRWSPFLLSGKIKPIDKLIEEKVKEIDLILKSKEFMERIESCGVQFHLEILKSCDGFQVNLSATKDIANEKKEESLLDSISYFVWKSR